MELKPKYIQESTTTIPSGWCARELGEIGACLIGLTYKPIDVNPGGTLVLRSSNVSGGSLKFLDNVYVDVAIPEKIILRRGDILICVRNGSRRLIGKCALIDDSAAGMTFGAFMCVFRTPYHDFVFQQFHSNSIKKQIEEHLGATINQITNKSLKSFQVLMPEDEKEQRAIVAALSDTDALLSSLHRLLAKKRDIKQAVMQQLLTGKHRLPGFSGEWEVKQFGNLASPRRDRVDPNRSTIHDFIIEMEHIEPETGRLIGSTNIGEQASLKSIFQPGDVLFGKLRAYLRKYWLADRQGICSTEIWCLVPNARLLISTFLFQLVKSEAFINAASTAYGTHMPRSDWSVVKNLEMFIPRLDEQAAIVAVLSDLDAEIDALQRRQDKSSALKQGMMQELLTGRTRLV